MGKVIAVANQKGGVGKTTSVINLTAALGKAGKKCLLVDVDSQGNSTSGLGINKREVECSVYDLLVGDGRASEAILKTQFKNVDLIPSSIDLAAAEVELAESQDRTLKLRQSLAAIRDQYDYILIDCPPSMGLVTLNAFSACDTVIIPIQCEYYALEGLAQLLHTIDLVQERLNDKLKVEGVILTMSDNRAVISRQIAAEIKKFFGKRVFDTVIPRNVRLAEAPSHGVPILLHDPKCAGARAYDALTDEYLQRTSGGVRS